MCVFSSSLYVYQAFQFVIIPQFKSFKHIFDIHIISSTSLTGGGRCEGIRVAVQRGGDVVRNQQHIQ